MLHMLHLPCSTLPTSAPVHRELQQQCASSADNTQLLAAARVVDNKKRHETATKLAEQQMLTL